MRQLIALIGSCTVGNLTIGLIFPFPDPRSMVFYLEALSEAITLAKGQVKFVLKKAAVFDKFDDVISDNQRKVLKKLFDAGPDGFDVCITKCTVWH